MKAKEVTVGAGASVGKSAATSPLPARQLRRTRSRLGCYTCRRRKKKCDEALYPVCQRCAAKGLPCDWPPQKHKLSRVLNQVVYVGPGLLLAALRADATSFVPAHKQSGLPQRPGPQSERPPSGVGSVTDAAAPAGPAPATPPTVGPTTGARPRSRFLATIALQQDVIAERDPDDLFEYLDPLLWATT
jgi:hypothetical protein